VSLSRFFCSIWHPSSSDTLGTLGKDTLGQGRRSRGLGNGWDDGGV